ncbi:MAG: hypothetical protein IPF46_15690 [Saprospiraceae bacterium]|nr:hypothetical protein [Candidatus Vicinibacter affinis]
MKNHSKYKQLEDEGWLSMQKSLDVHMPVKKNRRFILWYFLFLGALGSAFLLPHLFSSLSKSNPAKSIHHITPSQAQNQITDAHKLNESSNVEIKTQQLRPVKEKPIIEIQNKQNGNSFNESNKEIKNIPLTHNESLASEYQNKTKFKDIYPLPTETKIHSNIPNLNLLKSKICLLPLDATNIYLENKINPRFTKSTQKTNFEFGLLTGFQYNPDSRAYSVHFGSILERKINSSFSVKISPFLEYQTGDFLLMNTSEFTALLDNRDSLSNILFNLDSKSNTSSPNNDNLTELLSTTDYREQLYHIHLPIQLSYNWYNKWTSEIGFNMILPLAKTVLNGRKTELVQIKNNSLFVRKQSKVNFLMQIGLTAPVYKNFSINTGVSFPVSFSKSHADLLESTTGQTPSNNAPVNIITQTQLRASLIYKFGRIN